MKYTFNRNIIYAYILVIFLISFIPTGSFISEMNRFGVDKVIHLVEYFILGVLTHFFIKDRKKISKMMYIWIIIVPIVDEYIVQRISGRTVDGLDFLFNIIGLYLGASIFFLIDRYRDKKTYN